MSSSAVIYTGISVLYAYWSESGPITVSQYRVVLFTLQVNIFPDCYTVQYKKFLTNEQS